MAKFEVGTQGLVKVNFGESIQVKQEVYPLHLQFRVVLPNEKILQNDNEREGNKATRTLCEPKFH